jgi:hypothetical protein
MSAACGSEKDLWSEQISKIAKRFLRFARSSLVFGGEAAELHPEFTLKKEKRSPHEAVHNPLRSPGFVSQQPAGTDHQWPGHPLWQRMDTI